MIERDYIMRLMKQFFAALSKLINSTNEPGTEHVHSRILDMYEEYFGQNYLFFYHNNISSIVALIRENNSEEEALLKFEMLTELIYNDALLMEPSDQQTDLFAKALQVYHLLDENSKTFSLERETRIQSINQLLTTN